MASESVVRCGNCGTLLAEPPNLPPEQRTPCPQCGSTSRRFELTLTATVVVQGDAFQSDMAQSEGAVAASTALEDAGLVLTWLQLSEGGAWMLRIYDRQGNWVDGSIQDDPQDVLLAVSERLLPLSGI